jgi:hypothetical protein
MIIIMKIKYLFIKIQFDTASATRQDYIYKKKLVKRAILVRERVCSYKV